MSYTYQFKFYEPDRRVERDRVVELVAALLGRDARILDYEHDFRFVAMQPGTAASPVDIVAGDGTCLLRFTFPGTAAFLLQVYSSETKGAQATLAIDETAFETSPEASSELLLDLAQTTSHHLSPLFGWGDHELVLQRLETALSFDRIEALAWANLFSRSLADRLPVELLKQSPGHALRSFRQGLLYLLARTPAGQPSAETLSYMRRVLPGVALGRW